MADRTAVEYARAADSWQPADWWKLEAYGFHDVPRVQRALTLVSPRDAWPDLAQRTSRNPLRLPLGCLGSILMIVSFTVLPWFMMIAPFTALSSNLEDDPVPIAFGGVCAALAATVAGLGLARERSPNDHASTGRMVGWFHLIPAVIGTVAALVVVAVGRADEPIWIVAYFAELIVAMLHFVVYRGPRSTNVSQWRAQFRRLDEALADLEPDTRARVWSDVQQALTVLGASGLVSDDHLIRARQAPLGNLAITMAPRAELPEPDPSGRGPTPREITLRSRYDASLDAYRHVVDERAGRASGPPDPL